MEVYSHVSSFYFLDCVAPTQDSCMPSLTPSVAYLFAGPLIQMPKETKIRLSDFKKCDMKRRNK